MSQSFLSSCAFQNQAHSIACMAVSFADCSNCFPGRQPEWKRYSQRFFLQLHLAWGDRVVACHPEDVLVFLNLDRESLFHKVSNVSIDVVSVIARMLAELFD
nr:hypothetical protein [Prosthecochloris sp. GSB1]